VTLTTTRRWTVELDDLEVTSARPDKLLEFLTEMEFRSLTRRVAERLKVAAPVIEAPTPDEAAQPSRRRLPFDPAAYVAIRDRATLDRWIARIREAAMSRSTPKPPAWTRCGRTGRHLALRRCRGRPAYIPLGHRQGGGDLFGASAPVEGQLALDETLAALKPVLEDPAILKIGQNMKYDWKIFARHGVRIAPFDDTMLMSYAMQAGLNGHGMDELSERYLGHQPIPIKSLLGSGQGADHLRPRGDRRCGEICRRGRRHHAAAVAAVQAATAPRPGDHGLRDPGTPAGDGAGRNGDGRDHRRPRHAVAHVQRLRAETGAAGG
jgi:DNA polymerase-1